MQKRWLRRLPSPSTYVTFLPVDFQYLRNKLSPSAARHFPDFFSAFCNPPTIEWRETLAKPPTRASLASTSSTRAGVLSARGADSPTIRLTSMTEHLGRLGAVPQMALSVRALGLRKSPPLTASFASGSFCSTKARRSQDLVLPQSVASFSLDSI